MTSIWGVERGVSGCCARIAQSEVEETLAGFDRGEMSGDEMNSGEDQPRGSVCALGECETSVDDDDEPEGEEVARGSWPRYLRQLDWNPVTRSSRPRKQHDSCSTVQSRALIRHMRF